MANSACIAGVSRNRRLRPKRSARYPKAMAPTMMPINQRLTTEALCTVEVPEPLHNGDDAADDVDLKRVEQPGDAQDHREHKVPCAGISRPS